MKNSTVAFAAIVTIAGLFLLPARTAAAAGLTITDAKIEAGKLTVTGKTPSASQQATLDGQFNVRSNAQKNFAFNLTNYHPSSCVVQVLAGAETQTAVVGNCGQRGLTPRGVWLASAAYLKDDIVSDQGSAWRAKRDNTNVRPTPGADWQKFVSKGAVGPQGPAGPPGTVGVATVQFQQAASDLADGQKGTYDVYCPAGQQAIGGGARGDATNSEGAIVTSSRPAISSSNTEPPTDGGTFAGWRITVLNPTGGLTTGIRPEVWVICVAAP